VLSRIDKSQYDLSSNPLRDSFQCDRITAVERVNVYPRLQTSIRLNRPGARYEPRVWCRGQDLNLRLGRSLSRDRQPGIRCCHLQPGALPRLPFQRIRLSYLGGPRQERHFSRAELSFLDDDREIETRGLAPEVSKGLNSASFEPAALYSVSNC